MTARQLHRATPLWAPMLTAVLGLSGESDWMDRGVCAETDPDAFFPENGGSAREAKSVCMGCEVRTECLEYALARRERFGVWGGKSERQRRNILKGRSAAAEVAA